MPEVFLTADMVVLVGKGPDAMVLLVKRGKPPYQGKWALPGGYVEVEENERFVDTAVRELAEETGITSDEPPKLIGVYDDPERDPRGRVITVAFLLRLPVAVEPTAGDDAAHAEWVRITKLGPALAFDHNMILDDALMGDVLDVAVH